MWQIWLISGFWNSRGWALLSMGRSARVLSVLALILSDFWKCWFVPRLCLWLFQILLSFSRIYHNIHESYCQLEFFGSNRASFYYRLLRPLLDVAQFVSIDPLILYSGLRYLCVGRGGQIIVCDYRSWWLCADCNQHVLKRVTNHFETIVTSIRNVKFLVLLVFHVQVELCLLACPSVRLQRSWVHCETLLQS